MKITGHGRERWIERALGDHPIETVAELVSEAISKGERIPTAEHSTFCVMYKRYSMMLRLFRHEPSGIICVALITVLPKGERPYAEVTS